MHGGGVRLVAEASDRAAGECVAAGLPSACRAEPAILAEPNGRPTVREHDFPLIPQIMQAPAG
jgi:hypothetical protein